MSLFEKINEDLKSNMKEGRKEDVGIYRMILADIKNLAIEKNERDDIKEDTVLDALTRSMKKRQSSVEQYRAVDREDLAEKEEYEMTILSRYLPQPLTREELATLVDEAVSEVGAETPKDMGLVMKAVMPKTQGRADGKIVKELVMERLKG